MKRHIRRILRFYYNIFCSLEEVSYDIEVPTGTRNSIKTIKTILEFFNKS